MRGRIHRAITLTLLVALSGCDGAVLIDHFADPRSDEAGAALTQGVLDLAFAREYEATLDVVNEGSSDARIDEAAVTVWLGGRAEGPSLYVFTTPMSSTIAGGLDAAIDLVMFPEALFDTALLVSFEGYSRVDEIPIEELTGYRELVTLRVDLVGDNVGDDAQAFFQLELCYGCLVTCPAASTGENGELCEATTAPTSEPQTLGQDEDIDCRLCVPFFDAETCRDFCTAGS